MMSVLLYTRTALLAASMALTGLIQAQSFDLGAVDKEEQDGNGTSLKDWVDGVSGPTPWRPFQLSFVTSVGRKEIFAYDDLKMFAREWHQMVLPNTSSNELEYRMQQMDGNGLFIMNDQQNYAGQHRGLRFGYQAETVMPLGIFAGIHLMPLQWQATGTTAAGTTASINSARALVQPLVEDYLYLREIYGYYIPEPINMAMPTRFTHVELGVSKNLGNWVQIGASTLLAPGASNAIANWHENLVLGIEEPLFDINPGAGMNIPMTFCATISARYDMISIGISQFLQPAPETPTGGDPLQNLQYGSFNIGYAF